MRLTPSYLSNELSSHLRKLLVLVAVICCAAFPAYADAVLPSLALVSPIMVLFLLPVVATEAWYAGKRLNISRRQSWRVIGIANILSAVVGLPIGTVLGQGLQRNLEIHYYGTQQDNWKRLEKPGDVDASAISLALGQYPRWTLIVGAVVMLIVCFLISWWVEAAYARWWRKHRMVGTNDALPKAETSRIVRNANLLSYAFLSVVTLFILRSL
jgi:predicted Na+-dependent transporter